jgi:hypothetical protein
MWRLTKPVGQIIALDEPATACSVADARKKSGKFERWTSDLFLGM